MKTLRAFLVIGCMVGCLAALSWPVAADKDDTRSKGADWDSTRVHLPEYLLPGLHRWRQANGVTNQYAAPRGVVRTEDTFGLDAALEKPGTDALAPDPAPSGNILELRF